FFAPLFYKKAGGVQGPRPWPRAAARGILDPQRSAGGGQRGDPRRGPPLAFCAWHTKTPAPMGPGCAGLARSAQVPDILHAGLEGLDVAFKEAGLLLAELDADGLDDGLLVDDVGLLGDIRAQEKDVGALGVADLLSDVVAGDVDDVAVVAVGLLVDDAAVDEQQAARLDLALELEHGGQVHGEDGVRHGDERRGDGLVGDDDGAVGGAAAHLRAIAGQPGYVLAGLHAGLGKELADEEHALSAETGEYALFFHIITRPPY